MVVSLLLTASAYAQPPDAPPLIGQALRVPGTQFAQHKRMRRGDVESRVRTMKIWKMTEELDLSKDQAAKFFPLLNKMEDQQDDLREKISDDLEKLEKLVWDKNTKDSDINKLVSQIETYQTQELELRKQFRADVKSVLTAAQMGKLILFNHRFPQIMRELMQEQQGPPGPPTPRPGGNRW